MTGMAIVLYFVASLAALIGIVFYGVASNVGQEIEGLVVLLIAAVLWIGATMAVGLRMIVRRLPAPPAAKEIAP